MALTTNLTSYWSFNGSFASQVGSFSGTPISAFIGEQYGVFKGGCYTTGQTSYVTFGDVSDFDNRSAFSCSFWIFMPYNNNSLNLMGKFLANTQNCWKVATNSGNVQFYVSTGLTDASTTYVNTNNNTLTVGKWHHVCVVFDGTLVGNTNRAKVYVNGVNATIAGAGTIPAATTNGSGSFRIGMVEGSLSYATAYFDEIGAWTRALTSAEVLELYNGGIAITYPFDGSIYASDQTIQLCQFLLTSGYYRFSTARTNAIEDIQAAAIAGTVISQHDWNQFIYIVAPFYNLWMAQNELSV